MTETAYDILVAGNVNVETHLHVPAFPLDYAKFRPADRQVHDAPAGVGFNVAASLARLGHATAFAGLIGDDPAGALLESVLPRYGLSPAFLRGRLEGTPRGIVLSDPDGQSAIFSDLKNLQESEYPVVELEGVLDEVRLVYAGNINWTLPLAALARGWGKTVATDVHHVRSLDDDYHRRFLEVADVVFLSAEHLAEPPEHAIHRLWNDFDVQYVVCGCGAEGAVLGDRNRGSIVRMPAPSVGPVVSTAGAGDALAASFLSGILLQLDPRDALHRAQVFAGHMIGHPGATEGLLDAASLEALLQ